MPYDHALKDASGAADKAPAPQKVTTHKKKIRKRKAANSSAKDLLEELKRVQAKLEDKERALERRERQLEEAEEIGRMGHWYWKLGQEHFEWSAQVFRMFGIDKNEVEPTLFNLNDMVHASDVGRVNQVLQRAMIEEKEYEMDFRIRRPDGEQRMIRCEGRCAKDEDGDVYALYGIMQDMTAQILHEQQLRAERDKAERAYAAKSQFLANMSHELRTPLNAIIGFSEMMKAQILGPIGNEKYVDYIENIHQSGAHLLDLIGDILDMSKIEAGKYELDYQEISVSDTLQAAVTMMGARATEAGVKIVIEDNTPEQQDFVADRRAVMQVLLNLLSNAVKFSDTGDCVTLQANAREDYLSFKVMDEGVGIPAHKLSDITKPFEQVSHSYARDHEGTGLGLSITKELITLHGGVMAIDSEVGVGTTVTVRLPYGDVDS